MTLNKHAFFVGVVQLIQVWPRQRCARSVLGSWVKNHAGRGEEYGKGGKGAIRLPKILVLTAVVCHVEEPFGYCGPCHQHWSTFPRSSLYSPLINIGSCQHQRRTHPVKSSQVKLRPWQQEQRRRRQPWRVGFLAVGAEYSPAGPHAHIGSWLAPWGRAAAP